MFYISRLLRFHLHPPDNGHHHNVFLLLQSIFQQWNSTSWHLTSLVGERQSRTGNKLCTNEINPELPAGQGYSEEQAIDHKTSRWSPVNRTG